MVCLQVIERPKLRFEVLAASPGVCSICSPDRTGTLLGCEVDRHRVPPRAGLRIYTFGTRGDLLGSDNCFRDTYAGSAGSWVLIRPDGYVGAIVAADQEHLLLEYFQRVGM